jgi:hypothetical protein
MAHSEKGCGAKVASRISIHMRFATRAETKLAELRVPPHIRDLLFDHQPQRGSGAGYDHYQYGDEMREGIEAWPNYIAKLVQPKLVAENKA